MLLLLLDRLPLESLKNKIKRNLKLLESEGLVSAESDYQELINAIAKVRSLCGLEQTRNTKGVYIVHVDIHTFTDEWSVYVVCMYASIVCVCVCMLCVCMLLMCMCVHVHISYITCTSSQTTHIRTCLY